MENDQIFTVVAEVNGKVIANSELGRKRGYSEHVGEIAIGISKGYRNIGIGTEILKILITHAKEIGLKVLKLGVFSTNKRAYHVYQKVGFKETGRVPKEIFKEGKYVDHILMTQEL